MCAQRANQTDSNYHFLAQLDAHLQASICRVRNMFCRAAPLDAWRAFSTTLIDRYMEVHRQGERIKTVETGILKISYDVILKRRITKNELRKIAESIKAQHPNTERVFIGYFIAGTAQAKTRIDGHWGSSHWQGNRVQLLPGLSDDDVQKQRRAKRPTLPEGGKVLGRWFVPGGYGGHVVIYKKDGKTYLHQRYHDGSGSPSIVSVGSHKAGTAFREDRAFDYFVVTPTGDLEFWDNSGKLNHEKSIRTTQ